MVFAPFWSYNGIDVAHFGLESGMVFERTWGVYERIYPTYLFQIRKKEKYANSKWTWRIFCLHSNLSNGDIIFCLKARSENGCGKWHFLGWNRIRIWGTRWHTPTKDSQGYTPGKWPPPEKGALSGWILLDPIGYIGLFPIHKMLILKLWRGTNHSNFFWWFSQACH